MATSRLSTARATTRPSDGLFDAVWIEYRLHHGALPEKSERSRIVTLHIFGIKACDTMKKARTFLEARGVDHVFHDYKVEGVTPERLTGWAAQVGWEKLLNKAGTTFRKLPEADRQDLTEAKAIALMVAQPSLIKRPVLTRGAEILVGFEPEKYARFVG